MTTLAEQWDSTSVTAVRSENPTGTGAGAKGPGTGATAALNAVGCAKKTCFAVGYTDLSDYALRSTSSGSIPLIECCAPSAWVLLGGSDGWSPKRVTS